MAFKVTIDHDEIRQWIEAHRGEPAIVRGDEDDVEGSLTIVFGEPVSDDVSKITWEEFFDELEKDKLALRFDTRGSKAHPDFNFIDRNSTPAGADDELTTPPDNDELIIENRFSSEPNDPREL